VRQVDRTADVTVDVRTGKLSLIDLAGSERAARTKVRNFEIFVSCFDFLSLLIVTCVRFF
jgi:hypothetical protein